MWGERKGNGTSKGFKGASKSTIAIFCNLKMKANKAKEYI